MTSPILNYVIERYFKLTTDIETEISDKFHEIVSDFQWRYIEPSFKLISNIKTVRFYESWNLMFFCYLHCKIHADD